MRLNLLGGLAAVGGASEARHSQIAGQDLFQAPLNGNMVVDQQDGHAVCSGSVTSTVVPVPGADVTEKLAPIKAARSSIPRRPRERPPISNPTPSSRISSVSSLPSNRSLTFAVSALEWR